ncbi:MAG: glycosyltransferase family A protein [Thalassobaculaceae bacterium]
MPTTSAGPLVSVVIPAKNAANDLPGALDSAVSQGIDSIEIIIADDGSTDGTAAFLAAAKRKDRRILHLQTGGVGPAAARNRAICTARAPLIAFLDADDRWRPGKLPAQLAFHRARPDATLSFTDYQHQAPDGGDLGTCYAYWPRWRRLPSTGEGFRRLDSAAALILAENAVGTATVVARRDSLMDGGGFDPELRSASDWEMWIRLALAGPVGYSTAVAMDYRMIPGSVTSNRGLRIACMERILDRHGTAVRRAHGDAPIQAARARLAVARAEMARGDGRRFEALRHHAAAFLADPNARVLRATAADLKSLALG